MARDIPAELATFTAALERWSMDLTFDPDNLASVERAMAEMEGAIDALAAPFAGNTLVEKRVEEMKERYRGAIREKRPDEGSE
ncbi:hypothetical protein [Roseomonas chloroacetimidivorans]|uniref:hypothetical protein n=1 Tax=Roseomonas chloroacetimidivorans TaxID=1766656 RepID=UPI003C787FB3